MLFARNRLCALVRPGLALTPDNLLDAMLRDDVKLGTSTPKAYPSGDYAFEVLAKAEAIKPGSRATLEKKALQLQAARRARSRPTAARSMAGISPKDARTSSSTIARPRRSR